MKAFAKKWARGAVVLSIAAFGFAACGDNVPEECIGADCAPPTVGEPWPECEVSPIAWNFLIQCPREDEVRCNLGGEDIWGCMHRGQRCVERCSQPQSSEVPR